VRRVTSVRFAVFGPLVAEDSSGPLDLKGRRHRAVLARLLVARGRVVPMERLVDDLWESPPDGAVGAIQTFVSTLRRALEPDRPPRTPGRLLMTLPPGYALRVEPEAVDAWRFEARVAEAGDLLAQHRPETALVRVDEALGLWLGPAYAEFGAQAWARDEIARLDELRLLARERRAQVLLALGRAADVVPDLERQVRDQPWREEGWRLLALALYRAGRQGEALAALGRARRVLAAELGVDPGPELQRLQSDILEQAAHLEAGPAVATVTASARDRPDLVARAEELAQLGSAASAVRGTDRLGLVLVSGDAGAGKTALAEVFSAALADQGWTTAWGVNPDDEGLPAAWPWTQILDALAGAGSGPVPTIGPAAEALVARFHWHRAVGDYLAASARRAPLLLVLEDLHWAGEQTLALLTALVTGSVAGPVLVLATYRTSDVSADLAGVLGRVARAEPTRIYLGGLPATAMPDLIRATIGHDLDPAAVAVIHRRSGGNPFFVRELARFADTAGADWPNSVPPGVRDVVRHRVAALPGPVQTVLQQAAVAGSDIDLAVLEALSSDPGPVLDAIEVAAGRGFLLERGSGRFRFAHALVRDTVYHDLSRARRARWHAAVAEVLEREHPEEVDALAHHFLLADTPATAGRAARYTRVAADAAELRFAPQEAARRWSAALTAHDRAGGNDVRTRLELIMGLARALAVTGALGRARQYRAEALVLAEGLEDPLVTAAVIAAFDVPAIWTDNDDPDLARRVADLTERTLVALPPGHPAERSRLLATLALELRTTAGDRGRVAAEAAEALARERNDPALLAFALNARFMQSFERAGLAPHRARIGAELLELAAGAGLVTFEVLGHLVLIQAHAALADLAVADEHAAAADRLADTYQLPLVGVFTRWYRALRASVAGPATDAEAGFRAAARHLSGTGMSGLDEAVLPLALLCHRIQRGQRLDGLDGDTDFGRYEPWCRPLTLLAAGRADDARTRPATFSARSARACTPSPPSPSTTAR
jgi:DNA-binding SARP family transcriptional activator